MICVTNPEFCPFPHSLILAAAATWPKADWAHWHHYHNGDAEKYATKDASRLTEPCKQLISRMGELDCPKDTFPDFDLHGAGMHWIRQGGYLTRHTDGEIHPLTGWYRQWNAILFLSECSGGELLIDGYTPIQPKPGRLVTFDSRIPHEVLPITSGERMSLSMFWWSLDGTGKTTQADFRVC